MVCFIKMVLLNDWALNCLFELLGHGVLCCSTFHLLYTFINRLSCPGTFSTQTLQADILYCPTPQAARILAEEHLIEGTGLL